MIPTAATQHYNQQRRLAEAALRRTRSLWRRVGVEFDTGWARVSDELASTVQAAQFQAAQDGVEYLPKVLEQTGQSASRLEPIAPAAFAGVNRWGAPVAGVLHAAVIHTKQAVASGYAPSAALMRGQKFLNVAVPSLIADASSGAVQAGITSAGVTGYVRMLSGASCHRCIILAGRWYRWNKGFERHPNCDCRHIPSSENVAGDMTTDPYEAFHAMSAEDQDRTWGKANAQAIRDGADIYRVSNVKTRGLTSARSGRKYGTPSRMTLDDIYAEAGSNRTRAIELMRREGYIVGEQQLRQQAERFSTAISRPVVPGSARDRVQQARATGARDPLDRATMTAQEQRLFDATYRVEYARRNRYIPRSIGPNSADVAAGARGIPATAERMELLESALQRQIAQIRMGGAESGDMLRLVDALGLNDDRADIAHERIWRQMQDRFTITNGSRLSLAEALRNI